MANVCGALNCVFGRPEVITVHAECRCFSGESEALKLRAFAAVYILRRRLETAELPLDTPSGDFAEAKRRRQRVGILETSA